MGGDGVGCPRHDAADRPLCPRDLDAAGHPTAISLHRPPSADRRRGCPRGDCGGALPSAMKATVTVTGKSYGFYLSNLSWVTINGFSVTGTTNQGIYVTGSSNVTISGNHVTLSGRPASGQTKSGIYLTNTSSSLVSGNTTDHNSDAGIQLSTGSTGDEVRGNVDVPERAGVAAPGRRHRLTSRPATPSTATSPTTTRTRASSRATARTTRSIVNNVVYRNGDHGIDNCRSTGEDHRATPSTRTSTPASTSRARRRRDLVETTSASTTASTARARASNIRVRLAARGRTRPSTTTSCSSRSRHAADLGLGLLHLARGVPGGAAARSPTACRPTRSGANPAAGDFHLTAGSPAIDSANSGAAASRPPTSPACPGRRPDDAEHRRRPADLRRPRRLRVPAAATRAERAAEADARIRACAAVRHGRRLGFERSRPDADRDLHLRLRRRLRGLGPQAARDRDAHLRRTPAATPSRSPSPTPPA